MALKKICSKCKKAVIDFNENRCSKCQSENNKAYDLIKRDKRSKAFYNSKEWRALRESLLNKYGDMDLWHFAKTGEYKKANTLHHIIEITEDWSKRLDPDNLIPVSNESHSKIHKLYQKDKEGTQKILKEALEKYKKILR